MISSSTNYGDDFLVFRRHDEDFANRNVNVMRIDECYGLELRLVFLDLRLVLLIPSRCFILLGTLPCGSSESDELQTANINIAIQSLDEISKQASPIWLTRLQARLYVNDKLG